MGASAGEGFAGELLPQGGVHNNGTGLGQLQIVLEPGGRHLLPPGSSTI